MTTIAERHRMLRSAAVFAMLPNEATRLLAESSEAKLVETGDYLVRAGDPHRYVVLLASGSLRLFRDDPTHEVSLRMGILTAPALFGDVEWAAGAPWILHARADSDCLCLLIPDEVFAKTLEQHPSLTLRLYRDSSVRHLLSVHSAVSIALHSVRTRLILLLLDMAQRVGRDDEDGVLVDDDLPLVEIASALGVTRKTVSRTLAPLEASGILRRREADGRFVLRDLEAIEAEVPGDTFGVSTSLDRPIVPIREWVRALIRKRPR